MISTRLNKGIRIYEIQSQSINSQDLTEIISLHDYEGELTATWEAEPFINEKDLIGAIWDLQNEFKANVIYQVEEN